MTKTTGAVFWKIALLLLAGILLTADPSHANQGCKTKEQILESKIAIAKSKGNTSQVAGLEEALGNVRLYCNDGSLRGKAAMKLEEKREKVMEREAELEEAREKDGAKKIAKREEKLAEALREMADAERELKELQP
jgi:hypothetical protein